jgi:FAD synthetase
VIIARDVNVKHKPRPIVPEAQRMRMVSALKPVDEVRLGDLHDMFRPILDIDPDIITIGFNQHFDEARLTQQLRDRGIMADVVRIGRYCGEELCSSSQIVERILGSRRVE